MSSDSPVPRARSLTPDGAKIRQLRLSRGWRVEDLSKRAGCSSKTVESLEKGRGAYVYTLEKVAKAFGLGPAELIRNSEQPRPASESKPKAKIVIEAKIDFADFDETTILSLLRRIIAEFDGDVDVGGVFPGSTLLTVTVNADDAVDLTESFCGGNGVEMIQSIVIEATAEVIDVIARCMFAAEWPRAMTFRAAKELTALWMTLPMSWSTDINVAASKKAVRVEYYADSKWFRVSYAPFDPASLIAFPRSSFQFAKSLGTP